MNTSSLKASLLSCPRWSSLKVLPQRVQVADLVSARSWFATLTVTRAESNFHVSLHQYICLNFVLVTFTPLCSKNKWYAFDWLPWLTYIVTVVVPYSLMHTRNNACGSNSTSIHSTTEVKSLFFPWDLWESTWTATQYTSTSFLRADCIRTLLSCFI